VRESCFVVGIFGVVQQGRLGIENSILSVVCPPLEINVTRG